MCKYCDTNLTLMDQATGLNDILVIHDGNLQVITELFRSKSVSGDNPNYNYGRLYLSYGRIGGEDISQAEIAIKYCPFCGEEL